MSTVNTARSITLAAGTIAFRTGEIGVKYLLTGTPDMTAGAITLSTADTPSEGTTFTFNYQAVPTNYDETNALRRISIFGEVVPDSIATEPFLAVAEYIGAGWKVLFLKHQDTTTGAYIGTAQIEDDAVTTAKILDLNVTTGKVNDLAITTGKLAAEGVTNAKLAQMATMTIKGNDGGGSAVPQDLSLQEVRTMLDQDVTLTGDVTGTATQNFGTGVTSVTTTISADAVDIEMLNSTQRVESEFFHFRLDMAQATKLDLKFGYKCTIVELGYVYIEAKTTTAGTITVADSTSATIHVLAIPVDVAGYKAYVTGGWSGGGTNLEIAEDDFISVTAAHGGTADGEVFLYVRVNRTP